MESEITNAEARQSKASSVLTWTKKFPAVFFYETGSCLVAFTALCKVSNQNCELDFPSSHTNPVQLLSLPSAPLSA